MLVEVAPEADSWPMLTVIVPARDEAADVEECVRSLLEQDYPALEVIAVNDRSSDGTAAILDRVASSDKRMRVLHVQTLPAGWLGKNNACHVGAKNATGDWLLFTDGDVRFHPEAMRRALAFAMRYRLGHLVAFPKLIAPGYWERTFQTTFGLLLNLKFRVWELRKPRTHAFVGIGAFNLVERQAYESVGGHTALAFEVIDDVKLGLVLRRGGTRQGVVDAGPLVRVRWNAGLRGTMRGLIKNAFAGTDYRWSQVFIASAAILVLTTLPPLAAVLAPSAGLRVVAGATTLLSITVCGAAARRAAGGSGLEGLAFPACGPLLAATLLFSAVATTLRGGVKWRGTLYPLRELRAGCVRGRERSVERVPGW
jgi:cellulose synthase/poly-beta-1,6-N-acetylglucosamine synthase-like glycosyltransferase